MFRELADWRKITGREKKLLLTVYVMHYLHNIQIMQFEF